ncbi:MAG: F0F1 ATP synthase subunit B [Paracoccaceae bacterium]
MKKLSFIPMLFASPALAASGPFTSLYNTNYVVIIAFLLFIGVIVYLRVPGVLMGLLDARADGIRADLNEAKALREEAQTILASYERKQREVQQQADRIVEQAKADAQAGAAKALEDLKVTIERRLAAAQDQIASAEASAVKEVRDTAVSVAIAAASQVIADKMSAADSNALIDVAIETVGEKLH